jgi:hypothetical protein
MTILLERRVYNHWTDAEILRLKNEYPKIGATLLAKAMNRSIPSVRSMAKNLGVSIDRSSRDYGVDLSIISKEKLAYFAGLIDGEGSIFICKAILDSGMPSHNLEVTITNTNRKIIDWLLDNLGGTERNSGKRGTADKSQWAWVVRHHKARPYLEAMLPYLVAKRDQAIIALEFLDAKVQRINGTPIKDSDILLFEEFKYRISSLNSRYKP